MTTRTLELVDLSGSREVGGGPSLRDMAEALFRQRRAFLWTVAVTMAVTIALTLLTPRRFSSEMKILVRNARPDYLISPERSNGEILQHDVTEERINSEIEILRSRDVADAVVDPAYAAGPAAAHGEAERKAHETAVTEYLKHLTVENLRKSNVIHVTYTAASASEATAVLDKLLKAFLAKQREIERSTGASVFFAGEAARYKAELDAAEAQLAAYQQTSDVVSVPAAERTLDGQLTALDETIRATEVQITEAADRVAADRRQLGTLPARLPTQQRSIPNTQAVEELTATLNNYQNKRTALLTRYQPTDRLVIEADQQIADTAAALAEARAINGQESTTDNNPVYQQVSAVLAGSMTDLAALRGKLAGLNGQRDRLRRQLSGVEGATVTFSTLESKVAELESDYQLYSQKKNEAQMADSMDQQQLVNVAVAENPTFSAKPASPRIVLNLVLGAVTALFLAACAVLLGELGRVTVASARELEALSGLPVLATIPLLPGSRQSLLSAAPAPAPERSGGWSGGEALPSAPQSALARVDATVHGVAIEADDSRRQSPPLHSASELPGRSFMPIDPKNTSTLFASPQARNEQQKQPQHAEQPLAGAATPVPRTPARSFEQLNASTQWPEPPVREPRAYPASPPRLPGAAQPRYTVVEESLLDEAQPASAGGDAVRSSVPAPSGSSVRSVASGLSAPAPVVEDPLLGVVREPRPPLRSRLSPSQRAQQHRLLSARRTGEAYVTYNVEPARPGSSEPGQRKPDTGQ